MRFVTSSTGLYIRFDTDKRKAEYDAAIKKVESEYYTDICNSLGIWASNQERYVKTIEEFNQWDNRYMYNNYYIHSRPAP